MRQTEKGSTQQNQIRSLCSISGGESNNPIMCSTWWQDAWLYCCFVHLARTEIRSRDKRMMQNNETFWTEDNQKKVHRVCVRRVAVRQNIMNPRRRVREFEGKSHHCCLSGLACRQWPANSQNDTKGDQWVMDGGLVVQIQWQIIYWLDIRDPGWGSRCLKTDLNMDME